MRAPDFTHAPFIVIWEVTRACGLACAHCRAEAQPERVAGELSTGEGFALLDHVRAEFGSPLVVLTGGDPLERPDLLELIRHGRSLGLRMAITPSATPRLTPDAIAALANAGVCRVAISLDGADAAAHDGFRRVPGTFARSLAALKTARALGLETQINTTVWRGNRGQLRAIAEIAAMHEVALWSVFFLVPTGRAAPGQLLSPGEHERVFRQLADLSVDPALGLTIKTTAGQPYYRVLAQRGLGRGGGLRAPMAVNDGNGFVFISHTGDISPSGFLPLVAGNVRQDALAEVYRDHGLFTGLRDPDRFIGKCGRCPYNRVCGGSRSRAWALTGNPLASDPTCVYQPPETAVA
jgi:MoaA/NifB/PqqE/SkfB family radical SAM enzyme